MKTQSMIIKGLFCSLLLLSFSCRDISQQKGTEAGQKSNGDTRGTESPGDNQDSGKGSDTGSDSGGPEPNSSGKQQK